MEQHCISGEQLLLQLLGQPTQKESTKGKKKKLKKLHAFNVGVSHITCCKLIDLCFCLKGKVPNKPDDTWIMNRLIKQLTDMGFPVSAAYLCKYPKYPSVYLTVVPGVYFVILTS